MCLRFGSLASVAVDVIRIRAVASIGFALLTLSLTPAQSQAAPIIDFSVTSEGFDFRLQDVPSDPDYELFLFFFEPSDMPEWLWRLEVGHEVSHLSPGDPRFLNFYWEANHEPNVHRMDVGRTLTMSATDVGAHHAEAGLSLAHALSFLGPTLHIDDFVSTLDYVVGPGSEILAYDFRLRGQSRSSVPEPSALLLVGSAAALFRAMTCMRRRKPDNVFST